MASQPIAATDVVEIGSYVRSTMLTRRSGILCKEMCYCWHESQLTLSYSGCCHKTGNVEGHVPYNFVPTLSQFLKKEISTKPWPKLPEVVSTVELVMDWKCRASTVCMSPKLTLTKSEKFSGTYMLTKQCCSWISRETILWQIYTLCP